MQKSDRIFYGCFTKNQDGANRLIEKNRGCLCPTNKPFWKYPQDVPGGVETHSQEKNKKLVKKRDDDRYFRQVNCDNIWRWLEADESEVRYLKESDEFDVVR